jgi:hypothetical protein
MISKRGAIGAALFLHLPGKISVSPFDAGKEGTVYDFRRRFGIPERIGWPACQTRNPDHH